VITYAARRLLAALLLSAMRDATADNPRLALPARRWLVGEGAAMAGMLGLAPSKVTAWVDSLEALAWEQPARCNEGEE
jgi:hypothetical protein